MTENSETVRSTEEILAEAAGAKRAVAALPDEKKREALHAMAAALTADAPEILRENERDVEAARGHISDVMLDRLSLNEMRLSGMAEGICQVAGLPDPVGRILKKVRRPNGLLIVKRSVPLGVIAIIYESRPNVTSDAAALCLKSGNVCVLRCGREARRSAAAVVRALRKGLRSCGVPEAAVSFIEEPGRESAVKLMHAVGYVDLLIPRGGAGLIRSCVENATVPCIQTGTGICHVYVDRSADIGMALDIIENAKTSRPSVCNAEEVCLVHRDIAPEFLPALRDRLTEKRKKAGKTPVELRLDSESALLIPGTPAGADDFDTEFLDYILAVGIVGSVDEAIEHISRHSTGHSDCIVTKDGEAAEKFTREVDSAAVYVNASTRFTDGGEFGLGCEMGISTQKLHARGPMGLEELCTYKYIVYGSGQIR